MSVPYSHFTSPARADAIRAQGLRSGRVWLPADRRYLGGFQWLTRAQAFEGQHWMARLGEPPDLRITVRLPRDAAPRLFTVLEFATRHGLPDLVGIPKGEWQMWRIFAGDIPPEWLDRFTLRGGGAWQPRVSASTSTAGPAEAR